MNNPGQEHPPNFFNALRQNFSALPLRQKITGFVMAIALSGIVGGVVEAGVGYEHSGGTLSGEINDYQYKEHHSEPIDPSNPVHNVATLNTALKEKANGEKELKDGVGLIALSGGAMVISLYRTFPKKS